MKTEAEIREALKSLAFAFGHVASETSKDALASMTIAFNWVIGERDDLTECVEEVIARGRMMESDSN